MRSVVAGLAALVRRVPKTVLLVVIGLSLVLGWFMSRVTVATGNEGFAPDSREIAAAERIQDYFGSEAGESVVQILIREPGGDAITVDGLRAALDTSAAARASAIGEKLVDQPERPGVVHYLSVVERAMTLEGLTVDDMTDETVKAIYAEAFDGDGDLPPEQASFLSRLVSADYDPATVTASGGMALAFVASFDGDSEEAFEAQTEAEKDFASRLSQVETDLEVRPFSFFLLFTGVDDFTREVGRLFGTAFLVILVILLVVYWLPPAGGSGRWASARRTAADTLITLATILLAVAWTQGIGYLLLQAGVIDAFSAPTQVVPILLVGLGVDYAIHLTSRYREEIGEGRTVDEAVTRAIGSVGIALILATVTTVIGFLTNVFNPVPALKDFGILSAVGIASAFILMLTFVPSVRLLADRRAERLGRLARSSLQGHGNRLLPRIMEKLALVAERLPVVTIAIALLLGVAGWYGFSQLETRFSFTDFLPEDSEYVETLELLADDFGGGFGEQTQVLVEAPPGAGFDGSAHNALVDANVALAGIPDVTTVDSPGGPFPNALSPLSVLGQLLADPTTADPGLLAAAASAGLGPDLRVAEDADVPALYEAALAAAPRLAGQAIHMDGGAVDAVLFDISTTAGETVGPLRQGLTDAFGPVEEAGLSAVATSDNIIGDVVVEELTASQSRSLLITLLVSGAILTISFLIESRRWFLGLLTILPVGLVVLWTYGLMYATGIPFGPVTATLAALAIGIGVPYTIHIARRFQDDRLRHHDLEGAMRSTMRHTGGALAGSALTTMAGFGILMTASLVPFRQMGQVTTYAIGLSLVAAVLVFPSLLALWDRYHRRRGDQRIGSLAAGLEPSAEVATDQN